MGEAFAAIEGGFEDPVLSSQALFRAIMGALARPGTVQGLGALPVAPEPLTPELAAVALALADHDTPVWLDARLRHHRPVIEWLRFHTGAPLVDDPAAAAFAFGGAGQVMPDLADFAQGSDTYPDRSSTLVLAIGGMRGGPNLTLRGPGIDGESVMTPAGLPQGFVRQWHANRARFPRGVDILLVGGGSAIGLPRTTRIATEPV